MHLLGMGKILLTCTRSTLIWISSMGVLVSSLGLAQSPNTPVSSQETAHRRMAAMDAMQQLQQARNAYSDKRYTEAVEHYRNALSVLPKGKATAKLEQFIRESLADALVARAIDYRSVGRVEEALDFLKEAIKQAPQNRRAKVELAYTEDPVRTNPALTPRHIGDVEEVNRLLTLAFGQLDLANYDASEENFRAVLRIDRYNEAAARGLEQVRAKKQSYHKASYNARRSKLLSEVDASWDNALYASDESLPNAPVPGTPTPTEQAAQSTASEQEIASANQFENIRIPSINVENASISEVIEILQSFLRREQDQNAPSQRKLNIIGSFGSEDTPGYKELMQRRVSFRYGDLSLKELLNEVAERFSLAVYYVPPGAEFTYSGKNFGRLVDRAYTVPPHFFDNEGSGNEEGDDEENAFADSGLKVNRVDPVVALKRMGISFPKGAGANYDARSRRLSIRNTLGNVAEIEQLISESGTLNEDVIVISVIVMETSQEDLEDLGFEWLLNIGAGDRLFTGGGTAKTASAATGMPLITSSGSELQDNSPSVTSGLRSIRNVAGKADIEHLLAQGSVAGYQRSHTEDLSPTIFGFRGIWSTADVTMIMRGLSQKGAVDTLSTPKLVFSPGREEQSSIINVKELYYPTNYDPPRLSTSNSYQDEEDTDSSGNGTGNWSTNRKGGLAIATPAMPTDFVRYGVEEDNVGGVGSIMQVHNAEVLPDGEHVRLAITTYVNDFEGFVDWGSPINAGLYTKDQLMYVELTPNHILQPIFKRYVTNTSLVVRDGSVLVMGGMKEAKVVSYEDKVPVLGDLPLVGRLFRSSGSKKKQRVLLIFAKVNIVTPTGAPKHSSASQEFEISSS